MATHKVIQDIEAEDKFLGPLTIKQFIFGAIGVFFGWLNFFAFAKGFPLAAIVFAPPMLLGFFLAIPWSKDQPTEVWVLAKLRFRLKPKRRIWDQDGIQELVTITAPKKVEKYLTNTLSQTEVKSRLKALAETIDSRGWAIKHASLNTPVVGAEGTDRLLGAQAFADEVPAVDTNSIEDMFEDSPVSSTFDHMIKEKTQEVRQANLDKLDRIRQGEPLEAIHQNPPVITPPLENISPATATLAPDTNEKQLSQQLAASRAATNDAYENMHKIGSKKSLKVDDDEQKAQASIATPSTPAIMSLAHNDDLDVATIARQAKKEIGQVDEVVVSLH
jgi:hypothetical protein